MDWSREKLSGKPVYLKNCQVNQGTMELSRGRYKDQNECGDSEDILEISFTILRTCVKATVRWKGDESLSRVSTWVKERLPVTFIYLTHVICIALGTVLDTEVSIMNKNHKWYIRPASNCTVCWVLSPLLP